MYAYEGMADRIVANDGVALDAPGAQERTVGNAGTATLASVPNLKFVMSRALSISGSRRRVVDGVNQPQRRRDAEEKQTEFVLYSSASLRSFFASAG